MTGPTVPDHPIAPHVAGGLVFFLSYLYDLSTWVLATTSSPLYMFARCEVTINSQIMIKRRRIGKAWSVLSNASIKELRVLKVRP